MPGTYIDWVSCLDRVPSPGKDLALNSKCQEVILGTRVSSHEFNVAEKARHLLCRRSPFRIGKSIDTWDPPPSLKDLQTAKTSTTYPKTSCLFLWHGVPEALNAWMKAEEHSWSVWNVGDCGYQSPLVPIWLVAFGFG